ncbi:DUF4260 family protein, partial [Rhizobium ruizarguesonis]
MAAATTAYFVSGGNPCLYAILFFTPDLSFAAYSLNARLGAIVYNMVHSYISAILLAGMSRQNEGDLPEQVDAQQP